MTPSGLSQTQLGGQRSVSQTYLDWNDQIFDFFFPVVAEPVAVTLAFDGSALDAVALRMGVDPKNFLEGVRELVRSDHDNVLIWWTSNDRLDDRDPPFYCGLLAIFSLAAAEMGASLDGDTGRAFFHRHLARLLGLQQGLDFVGGYSEATRFYDSLDFYLRETCGGVRGTLLRLSALYGGGRYVAMARAQVLLTHAERLNLRKLFTRELPRHQRLGTAELTQWLISAANRHENEQLPVLRRVGEISSLMTSAAAGAKVIEQFSKLIGAIEVEYFAWYSDATATKASLSTVRIASDSGGGAKQGERVSRQALPAADVAEGEAKVQLPPAEKKPKYSRRLVLHRSFDESPWQIQPQVQTGAVEWQNALVVDSADNGEWLAQQRPDGIEEILEIGNVVAFQHNGTQWVSAPNVHAGERAYLMVSKTSASQVTEAVEKLGQNVTLKALSSPFHDRVIIGADLTFDRLPESLPTIVSKALSEGIATVTLRRGLKNANGYFSGAPPRVFFDHPSVSEAALFLDGIAMDRARRREEFLLPANLAEGKHVVHVLDINIEFFISDNTKASSLILDERIGYEVCYRYGIMRPSEEPGAITDQKFRKRGVQVLCVFGSALL